MLQLLRCRPPLGHVPECAEARTGVLRDGLGRELRPLVGRGAGDEVALRLGLLRDQGDTLVPALGRLLVHLVLVTPEEVLDTAGDGSHHGHGDSPLGLQNPIRRS